MKRKAPFLTRGTFHDVFFLNVDFVGFFAIFFGGELQCRASETIP